MTTTTPTAAPTAAATYLSLLEARVTSKARKQTRVPVCLDPARLEKLDIARQALHTAKVRQPLPNPGAKAPIVKMNAKDPIAEAQKHLDEVEEFVREASLNFVMTSRSLDEMQAAGVAKDDQMGVILLALDGVEDLDGHPVPEITPDRVVQLLPTLSPGERALLFNGITTASSAPDFPTSRR